ncbi:two-component system response regulator [Planctomycetales bacterium]|nr:two-component system response regulator [Planctomycetales bacterium]GHT35050.1 two-component system response regulator [Planctomycetales bacterium]
MTQNNGRDDGGNNNKDDKSDIKCSCPQKKVLVVGDSWGTPENGIPNGEIFDKENNREYEICRNIGESLLKIRQDDYDYLLVEKKYFGFLHINTDISQEKSVLENLPAGLARVDTNYTIIWHNRQFSDWCSNKSGKKHNNLIGLQFYQPLGNPELKGPDFCPFKTVKATKKPTYTAFMMGTNQYMNMNVVPICSEDGEITSYLVEIHDATEQKTAQKPFFQIRQAGHELANLSKDDVLKLKPEERIAVIKAKIIKSITSILHFTSFEIRILSHLTPCLLEPFLSIGMSEEASNRVLYARQEKNGITGWVAFHGQSYRMDDRSENAFYLEGTPGARSSITVPLKRFGKIIGTFNVESQKPNAFSEDDLRLIESYADDVAAAIGTLDLLNYEQKDSAFKSIETVYSESVNPLNRILNECVRLLQSDLSDNAREGLTGIQNDVRTIQGAFLAHGEEVRPDWNTDAISEVDCRNYEVLRGKRILLIDGDETAGRQLSTTLYFYGNTVETALQGCDALNMAKTTDYDAFISNVKLKDMSAFTLFEQIRSVINVQFTPYIFMTSFGYDGNHVIVRARQAGVLGYIYKPFKLPQLLKNLKTVISEAQRQNHQ